MNTQLPKKFFLQKSMDERIRSKRDGSGACANSSSDLRLSCDVEQGISQSEHTATLAPMTSAHESARQGT